MGKVPYETIWLNMKTNLVSEPQTVCLSIAVILPHISIDRSVFVCVCFSLFYCVRLDVGRNSVSVH